MSYPNTFIVGAAKAGTTSLHHYLGQHPQVFMSAWKEPHHFADIAISPRHSHQMRRYADEAAYRALFADADRIGAGSMPRKPARSASTASGRDCSSSNR